MPVSMKIPVAELSRGALEALTECLLAENAALKQQLAAMRDTLEKRLAALEARSQVLEPRVAKRTPGKHPAVTINASLDLK